MHGTVRRYRVRLGTIPQAVKYVRGNLLPLLKQIPGFTAYYLFDAENNTLASVMLYQTAEGAEAANQLASRWFRSDWPSFQLMPPEMVVAEVLTHEGAAGERDRVLAAATPLPLELARVNGNDNGNGNGNGDEYLEDRRGVIDRRSVDRRSIVADRRRVRLLIEVERRAGVERRVNAAPRSGADRRSGEERSGREQLASPAWVPLLAASDASPPPDAERAGRILARPAPDLARVG
jgi:hypothetical protein